MCIWRNLERALVFQKKMKNSRILLSFGVPWENFHSKGRKFANFVWNLVVGLEFATAYAFADILFLSHTGNFFPWIITENYTFGFFCITGTRTFQKFTKPYVFRQFMASKVAGMQKLVSTHMLILFNEYVIRLPCLSLF